MTKEEPNGGSNLVDRVAEAIWNAQRAEELNQIAAFEFDKSVFRSAGSLLIEAGPREQIVVIFSLISHCVDKALRYHFSHSTKTDQKELLEGLGPLASDAARIKLLRVLGWVSPELADAVDGVRRLRNRLSHSLDAIALDSHIHIPEPLLTRLCSAIDKGIEAALSVASEGFRPDGDKARSIPGIGLMLAGNVLEEIVTAPACLRLGIPVGSRLHGFDDAPAWLTDVRHSVVRALLEFSEIP